MNGSWITSWYWKWRPIESPPPSTPQLITDDRARGLLDVLERVVLTRGSDDGAAGVLLALAHRRLTSDPSTPSVTRVDYRVSSHQRFLNAEAARGAVRKAIDHVVQLEARGKVGTTRGPFHLSEVLAQSGLAAITLRADLVHGESDPRIATYLPVAMSSTGLALEPMQIALWDVAQSRLVWCADDAISRAWHAPMAGGEILTLLPAIATPVRVRVQTAERSTGGGAGNRSTGS